MIFIRFEIFSDFIRPDVKVSDVRAINKLYRNFVNFQFDKNANKISQIYVRNAAFFS